VSQKPPKQLWDRGIQDGCETAVLEVRVCKDSRNQVWSTHKWQTEEDAALTQNWPEGGAKQVAHALLTEALRRETYALVLGELTKDKDYISDYSQGDEMKKTDVEERLCVALFRMITMMTKKMRMGLVPEILLMVEKSEGAKPLRKE